MVAESAKNKVKVIKDSIHGYIEVDEILILNFIDTPLFQRLRRVEQTSMRVLYPSARHDRFIHSIGTFYLGSKAFNYFKENFIKDNEDKYSGFWDKWERSFTSACLLHDIGHAPFSHTCENFFAKKMILIDDGKREIPFINQQLLDEMGQVLGEEEFKEFFNDYRNSMDASPHEIVSCIVILKKYIKPLLELGADIELIIRAIIGCTYCKPKEEKGLKNCIIRMLNSPVIDVDKLDYITRDTNLTGFENISIDTERLLRSFTAVKEKTNDYYPAYNKNALSVIQNIIAANNAQQSWIVNHHVVVYHSYLLQTAIRKIAKIMSPDRPEQWIYDFFSVDSIIGKVCCNGFEVNMLCDDDLWYLLKKYYDEVIEIKELLDRNIRKRAVWKSLAEFTMLFDDGKRDKMLNEGDFSFSEFVTYFGNACSVAENLDFQLRIDLNESDKESITQDYIACSEIVNEFAKTNDIEVGQFVILQGGDPQKNKAVIARDKLRIQFSPGENGTKKYDEVMRSYPHAIQTPPDDNKSPRQAPSYFYLYYCSHLKEINKDDLCRFLKASEKFKHVARIERA